MLNKVQNSILRMIRQALSPEFNAITSNLDENAKLLNTIVQPLYGQVQSLDRDLEILKLLMGKTLANQVKQHGVYDDIQDAEFSVFSQFGDDGIIQYLVHQINPANQTFIEFGTQNYRESNTRFLLMNNNWKGLIIEGDPGCIESVKQEPVYWKYDLTAVNHFIDKDNINRIFMENGFSGEIGLLSIDIDGNDYWIWESINSVDPVMVVAEYNGMFGPDYAITIPYDPQFYRTTAHYSNLYWGCSLKALCLLAERKGYVLAGTNSNGNNAHFIRKDKVGDLIPAGIQAGYTESRFRESRDQQGNLTYLSGSGRLRMIKDMKVYNIESGTLETIESLFGL
jgi:hypothetical protein